MMTILDAEVLHSSTTVCTCVQVLGKGDLTKALTVHATAFSESAKAAIEKAGGKVEVVPGRAKWTKKAFKKLKVSMAASGQDYEKEKRKKRIDNLKAKGMFVERVPKVKATVSPKRK